MNTELPSYTPINDARIAELTALAEKAQAHIKIIHGVRFVPERYKHEHGTIFDCDVEHKFFRRSQQNEIEADIVLLNFPNARALNNLEIVDRYRQRSGIIALYQSEILYIGEQDNAIFKNLGHIVAPVLFDGRCYDAWWNSSTRGASSDRSSVSSSDWFAFRE